MGWKFTHIKFQNLIQQLNQIGHYSALSYLFALHRTKHPFDVESPYSKGTTRVNSDYFDKITHRR